jgi:hypothetical protein
MCWSTGCGVSATNTPGKERSSDEGSRLAKNGTGSSRSGVSTPGPKVSRKVVEPCFCDLNCCQLVPVRPKRVISVISPRYYLLPKGIT